tara:strand:+ start:409 stop:636 length:228 start_codon:yes stop_codon:yes gene_type:complete
MKRKNKIGKFLKKAGSKLGKVVKEATKYVRINDPYVVRRAVSLVKGMKASTKDNKGTKQVNSDKVIKGTKRTILK